MSRLNKSSCGVLLCYVTDRCSLCGSESAEQRETLLRTIAAASAVGVDWIQIREKDLAGKDCASLTLEALERTAKSATNKAAPSRVLVNDRLDLALSQKADGVHLGENSLPLAEAKRLVGDRGGTRDFLVGVSCHSLEAARVGAAGGADYLFFGPVFATPSKASFGAPQGLERLAEVCQTVSVPVLAIGGITVSNASSCLRAGASGIAAIRLFQDARDISSIVHSLKSLTP